MRISSTAAAFRPVAAHRLLLALLRSPLGRLIGSLCELRFAGRISGRLIALPVQCVRDEGGLVIYVSHGASKQWWRNFIDVHPVQVHVGGATYPARGRVVEVEHPDRALSEQTYRRRCPKVDKAPTDPLVIIDLADGLSRLS